MTLISSEQLETLFMDLPEDRVTPGKLWCLHQKYDQAWHYRQNEDVGIQSFEVYFEDTTDFGWSLRVDGFLLPADDIQSMIHDLPAPDEVPADSYDTTCSHTVASPRGTLRRSIMHVLRWEKAIFTDSRTGEEYVDWAIEPQGVG